MSAPAVDLEREAASAFDALMRYVFVHSSAPEGYRPDLTPGMRDLVWAIRRHPVCRARWNLMQRLLLREDTP